MSYLHSNAILSEDRHFELYHLLLADYSKQYGKTNARTRAISEKLISQQCLHTICIHCMLSHMVKSRTDSLCIDNKYLQCPLNDCRKDISSHIAKRVSYSRHGLPRAKTFECQHCPQQKISICQVLINGRCVRNKQHE